ncbi:MAG TPA: TRAP transporter substrate-binding protein [Stellaceae bacterium]|jgi:tripartite ATP-independent transporter DctP family solute receptor
MPANFHYRLGLNQPGASPSAKRMAELGAAIGKATDGRLVVDVFPESRLGPDPQMFADVQAGKLEFFVSGATLGGIAPASALPMMPFAFDGLDSVFAALDGGLGDIIRGQLEKAGLHAFRRSMLNGFHHITTSTRAIETVDDFKGLKIRSPGGALSADFFQTLGAEAGMVPFSGMYDALKAKTFDGQSDPLGVVQSLKLYEVQTHLSLTGHWWSGFTLLANGNAWAALPHDIQEIVEAEAEKAALAQRQDVAAINETGAKTLEGLGMLVNTADSAGIRSRLGDFYARWKAKFDAATWRELEAHAGGLG